MQVDDYIHNLCSTRTRDSGEFIMGLDDEVTVNKLLKLSAELRGLVEKCNAYAAELREQGYTIKYTGNRNGNITNVQINKIVNI